MGKISEETAAKIKKAVNVTMNVLLYVFMALCVVMIITTVTTKKSDTGMVTVFGKQIKIVETQSMEWQSGLTIEQLGLESEEIKSLNDLKIKEVPRYSMIFIDVVPQDEDAAKEWYKTLKVGDVVTFMYGEYGVIGGKQPVITHRVTAITEKAEGRYLIELNGDNKGITSDTQSYPADTMTQIIDTGTEGVNYVIGKVTGQSKFIGKIIHIVQQPVGIICIVILPCTVILVLEIIKIVGYFVGERKKKLEKEREEQQSEIELLKKELQALKTARLAAAANRAEYEAKENNQTGESK